MTTRLGGGCGPPAVEETAADTMMRSRRGGGGGGGNGRRCSNGGKPLELLSLLLLVLATTTAGFVLPTLPATNNPFQSRQQRWLVSFPTSTSNRIESPPYALARQTRRRAVAAAAVVPQQEEEAAVEGGQPRSLGELLEEIKANAGTPQVLSLLKEAVAATGTGEVKKEFFKVSSVSRQWG